jgi:hypothetical protein
VAASKHEHAVSVSCLLRLEQFLHKLAPLPVDKTKNLHSGQSRQACKGRSGHGEALRDAMDFQTRKPGSLALSADTLPRASYLALLRDNVSLEHH